MNIRRLLMEVDGTFGYWWKTTVSYNDVIFYLSVVWESLWITHRSADEGAYLGARSFVGRATILYVKERDSRQYFILYGSDYNLINILLMLPTKAMEQYQKRGGRTFAKIKFLIYDRSILTSTKVAQKSLLRESYASFCLNSLHTTSI